MKRVLSTLATNEGLGQSTHPCRLLRDFAVCSLEIENKWKLQTKRWPSILSGCTVTGEHIRWVFDDN